MTLTPLGPWIARKIGQPALHRADLEVYQLQKLRETIHWARAHSPFYRRQLAEAPPELASLDALAGYPLTPPLTCAPTRSSFCPCHRTISTAW